MDRKRTVTVFVNGMLKDNPFFTAAVGVCTAVTATYSIRTAFFTGLFVCLAMAVSSSLASAMKYVIPANVRIPCHMLIVVGSLTLFRFMVNAYFPMVEHSLNPYFLTVACSCLLLARAEGFAVKNSVSDSFFDALGVGVGYTLILLLITCIREILGSGTLFGKTFLYGIVKPMDLFAMAPGVLFIAGCLCAAIKYLTRDKEGRK